MRFPLPLQSIAVLAIAGFVGTAYADSKSLCSAQEETVFGCRYKAKVLSVCAASDQSGRLAYVQYRFGAASPELAIPERHPFDLNMLRGEVTSGAHGGTETLVFKNGEHSYQIQTSWDMRSAKYDAAEIQVFIGEKVIGRFECKPTTALGRDDQGLRRLVTASGMRPVRQ